MNYIEIVNQAVVEIRNERLEEKKKPIASFITFYLNFQNIGVITTIPYRLPYRVITNTNYSGITDEELQKLSLAIEKAKLNGSGYTFVGLKDILLSIDVRKSKLGGSYKELPQQIKDKKAIINVKNDDNKCFMYAILSHLHPADKNSDRVSKYKDYINELKFNNLEFPINIDEVWKFEKYNDLSINVWLLDKKYDVYIGRHSSLTNKKQDEIINLLLHDGHYSYIKNFSRLISSQKTKDGHQIYPCFRCKNYKTSQEALDKHIRFCQDNNQEHIEEEMPTLKNDSIFFKNGVRSFACPYRIYCDFESSIINDIHKVNSYGLYLVNSYGKKMYNIKIKIAETEDENIAKDLVETLLELYAIIEKLIDSKLKHEMIRNSDENKDTNCVFCNRKNYKGDRTIFINPFTDEVEGHAHFKCIDYYNKHIMLRLNIPVIMHNLKGYDSHFIIQEIGRISKNINDIMVIPTTKEKYLSFGFEHLQFIDSFAFLPKSLDELVKSLTLSKDESKFDHIKTKKNYELYLRKGIYCYEFVTGIDKLNTPISTLTKENFFSKLKNENVSDEDFEYFKKVCEIEGSKTLRDAHKHYLESDVLLLACVFETFCKMAIEYYKIDPSQFFSLAGYSWDAMLKMTNVKLELIKDNDTHHIFESAKLGGMNFISNRYQEINEQEEYISDGIEEQIKYYDINNLYGWAMMKPLPMGEFKREDPSNWNEKRILSFDSQTIGYRLVVDLEYPAEIHDWHNDFPLAPEKRTITESELSEYQKSTLQDREINLMESEKLINTLYDKDHYSVEINELKLYLQLGMKLKKIHDVISYKTSCFLKPYIEFNTSKRDYAKSINDDFGKELFKLMNNVIYGKTIENIRGRMNFKLANNEKTANDYLNAPELLNRTIFGENLVGFEFVKRKIMLNKPVAVGVTILAYSKTLMYDLWYNKLKKEFGNDIKLLGTDTDSIIFYVKGKNIDERIKKLGIVDKNTIGSFKDEYPDKKITSWIGLRSKMYSLKFEDQQEKKVAKGIQRGIINNILTFNDYKKALLPNHIPDKIEFHIIASKDHQLSTKKILKDSVSGYDDKSYLINSLESLRFGHYRIKEIEKK